MATPTDFFRAIEAAEWDDDTPRLVYADWLDENGDEDRAEFIRVQCGAARIWRPHMYPYYTKKHPSEAEQARHEQLNRRSEQLLAEYRSKWAAGLPEWALEDLRFWRGMPDVPRIDARQLIEDGGRWRAVAPLPNRLIVRRLLGAEVDFFRSEHVSVATALIFLTAGVSDEAIQILAECPHLSRVTEIDCDAWRRGPHLTQLLTDVTAMHLAWAENLHALTELSLNGYDAITIVGIRALLESQHRSALTSLGMSGTGGGPAIAELFASPTIKVTQLEVLNLYDRRIGDRGAAILAGCPSLARLVELRLGNNGLSDTGLLALLASPYMKNLRRLRLHDNRRITDAGARAILADGRRWSLVDVRDTGVSDGLVRVIQEQNEEMLWGEVT